MYYILLLFIYTSENLYDACLYLMCLCLVELGLASHSISIPIKTPYDAG